MSQDNSSSEMTYLIAFAVVVALVYFAIQMNYHYIIAAWRYLKIFELSIFYYMPEWVPFYGKMEIKEVWGYLVDTPSYLIHRDTVDVINERFGGWLSWPFGLLILVLGAKKALAITGLFVRYDEDTLLVEMSRAYPFLEQYLEKDLTREKVAFDRELPETMSTGVPMWPEDWSQLNPPLLLEKEAKSNRGLRNKIWDGHVQVDLDLAERAFVAQLGERYRGLESLSETEKKSFEVLRKLVNISVTEKVPFIRELVNTILRVKNAKRINRASLNSYGKELYDHLAGTIETELKKKGRTAATKKKIASKKFADQYVRGSEARSLLNSMEAETMMDSHAFIRCGLVRLFLLVRTGGVFNEAVILNFTKSEDRTLWLAFSSTSRQVAWVEASGIFAHMYNEIKLGEPLTYGEVSSAIQGLEEYLKIKERIDFENFQKNSKKE
ncbi:hypothetical protein AB4254_08810 [Vibrio breoganii]